MVELVRKFVSSMSSSSIIGLVNSEARVQTRNELVFGGVFGADASYGGGRGGPKVEEAAVKRPKQLAGKLPRSGGLSTHDQATNRHPYATLRPPYPAKGTTELFSNFFRTQTP